MLLLRLLYQLPATVVNSRAFPMSGRLHQISWIWLQRKKRNRCAHCMAGHVFQTLQSAAWMPNLWLFQWRTCFFSWFFIMGFDRLHHIFGHPNDPKFWAILDAWAASEWSKRFQNVNAIGAVSIFQGNHFGKLASKPLAPDEWDVLGDVLEFPDCTPRISGYSQFLLSWDTWTICQLSQMVVTFW